MCSRGRRSPAALQRELRTLKQLRTWGLDLGEDVEIPDLECEPGPVELTLGEEAGAVWNTGPMSTIYALPVVLTAMQPAMVVDVEIVSPWDADSIVMVETKFEKDRAFYRYGPASYRKADILNPKFRKRLRLKRGQPCEGVILAEGCIPVPADFTARNVPLSLTVIDTLHRVSRSEITLPLERAQSAKLFSVENRVARRRSSLYDDDPVQPARPEDGTERPGDSMRLNQKRS